MAEFEEIYSTYARRVYRFLLALSRNTSVAEELTQQTFYQAFLHIGQFEGRSSLFTWLCQIGKNEWFRECRRSRIYSNEDTDEVPCDGAIDEAICRREETGRAVRALCGLETPYRDVVILRIYGQLPFSEIAALFAKSESWAKVTFFRGKVKLRERIGGEE
jgi:RNA polymerase sigma-70 factor (ECF subfamily)